MQQVSALSEMRRLAQEWHQLGRRVALVPTQGALHAGQEALIRAAVAQVDIVVVSIFVNPLQFAPNERPEAYPRSLTEDLKLAEAAGAQVAFTPAREEMYPRAFSTYVNEELVAKPSEGVSRPNHFRGVATVMARLFNLVQPEMAVGLGDRKAAHIGAARPDIVVTANPGCLLQIRAAAARADLSVRVVHLVELLDEATVQ